MPNITKIVQCSITFCIVINLSACSSDNPPTPEIISEPPSVNQARAFNGPLGQTSPQQVEQFIKNGIYATSIGTTESAPIAASDAETAAPSENFSQTNTVEQGVDEADRLKYDGNYMYVAEASTYYFAESVQPQVRVLKRNDDFTLTPLGAISSSLEFDSIDGIYLHDNTLAVLGTNNEYNKYEIFSNDVFFSENSKVSVSIFDVTNPEQSTESAAFQIDGSVLATRRIDNSLYIISTYAPRLDNLTPSAYTDADKLANFKVVSQTPIGQLMPQRYQDGQQIPLTSADECYIPTQATAQDGYAQFLNVTKINLAVPTDIQSVCLTTIADTVYMSPNNLYLAVNIQNQDTLFHKIDLNTFDYVASGSVEGQLSWRSNPLFRLHENDNELRVVTTDYTQADPFHRLSILQQQGTDLTAIATLPNDTAPQQIGKPGEDIFAVRFIQEKAYIVTFENIDPLYVINLSDSSSPFIEGELEIPGFSSYIHPLDNDYLLGIGQQVSFNDLPQVGIDPIMPPLTSGMKISLFDVRDPANPIELSNLVSPNAYTPVEFDYKALSVLNTGGVYQFALPLEEWGGFNDSATSSSVVTNQNSLMLLETDTTSNVPELSLINKISASRDAEFYFYAGNDRSIIQGNKVYYLRGNQIWLGDWSQESVTLGPY
jgi:uncharacterized secreted protein with C-terminal beta-propeller domain